MKKALSYGKDLLITLIIFLATTLICYGLDFLKISDLNFLIIYVLGVIICIMLTKAFFCSVLLSFLSVFGYNFFFTYPRYTFHITDPAYGVTFLIMLIINIIIIFLMHQLKHRFAVILHLQEEKLTLKKETEKEQLKVTILQSISHDLRTPLTTIKDGADLIAENPNMEREDEMSIIEDIRFKADWMVKLVENLLSITRINSDHLSVLKKDEAIEEVLPEAIKKVDGKFKNRNLHLDIPPELLLVPMDAILITQVITNILNNAVRFTSDGGNIWIKVWSTGQNVIFRFINDGKLINEIDLPNLFDIYYTTSETEGHSGIGLAISKLIITSHGGTISAYNMDDKVCFEFSLPLRSEENG